MDILHWLELHTDVHVNIDYLAHWEIFVITMVNDEWYKFRTEISKASLNRAKYTITDILDDIYEGLKEYKYNGYLSDDGSAGASDTKSSSRI